MNGSRLTVRIRDAGQFKIAERAAPVLRQPGDDLAVGMGEQIRHLAVGDRRADWDRHPVALVEWLCVVDVGGVGVAQLGDEVSGKLDRHPRTVAKPKKAASI